MVTTYLESRSLNDLNESETKLQEVFIPANQPYLLIVKENFLFLANEVPRESFLGHLLLFFSHLSNLRHLVNYRYSYGMGWNHLWNTFTCITWVKEEKLKCTFCNSELELYSVELFWPSKYGWIGAKQARWTKLIILWLRCQH